MADPVAFQFWAPPAAQLDTSPLVQGAQTAAAGYIAAGQAIGQGIKEGVDVSRKQQAEEAIGKAMDEIGSDSNYELQQLEPWMEDPSLAQYDKIGARQAIKERLMSSGFSESDADVRSLQATSAMPVRVLKPAAVAKIRGLKARAMSLASKSGMGGAEVERALNLVTPDAYESIGHAHMGALDTYRQAISPPQLEQTLLEQALLSRRDDKRIQADKEERAQIAKDQLAMLHEQAGIEAGQARDAHTRAIEKIYLEQNLADARSKRDADRTGKLTLLKHDLDMEEIKLTSKLSSEERQALEETKSEFAMKLAELKASGGTPEQARAADEFALNVAGSTADKSAFEGIPSSSIRAIDNRGYFKVDQAGDVKFSDLASAFGVNKGTDASGIVAQIGPDGEAHLTDRTGASKLTDAQLEQISRSMFGSPQARSAVVLQQIYRSADKLGSDLSTLLDSPRGAQLLEAARAALARGAAIGSSSTPAKTNTPAGNIRKHR